MVNNNIILLGCTHTHSSYIMLYSITVTVMPISALLVTKQNSLVFCNRGVSTPVQFNILVLHTALVIVGSSIQFIFLKIIDNSHYYVFVNAIIKAFNV